MARIQSHSPFFGIATVCCCLLGAGPARPSDFDVVITEIHYNPLSGLDADEFIEVYNRGATTVDLTGWAFTEGVRLTLPAILLEPRQFLVFSPDAERTRTQYGVEAVGNYLGRLDNGGELITLVNAQGDIVSRVHYGDGQLWPSTPDGLGPSLERTDPHARPDLPWSWASSRRLHGTPGEPNSTAVEPPSTLETVLVEEGEDWRYLKGTDPYPEDWQSLGFNDGAWETGPTGIGYGDGDDNTILDDMEDSYLSFAARKTFSVSEGQLAELGELHLLVDYDDGFVAYLNGTEIARSNLGSPGEDVAFDAEADDNHEAGVPELFLLSPALLETGINVLAAQVHNDDLGSSDASFLPRLVGSPAAPEVQTEDEARVVINEVKATESATSGFIELYNRRNTEIEVGGYVLVTSDGNRSTLPGNAVVPAAGTLVLDDSQLSFPVELSRITYALVEDDGRTFVDGLDPRQGLDGENGFSFGRFPDGDDDGFVMTTPTPGAPNQLRTAARVVVNEIHFHPPFVPTGDGCTRDCSDLRQWIELYNVGGSTVDLNGWSLTKAVDFDFPDGTEIAPGDFLIVASSRTQFLADHPEVNPDLVVGVWDRDLAHDSDTINLRDELGNLVDHVKYGDGGPRNDEEPEDDVDDGTFHGSPWPPHADGTGRTLELVHPLLDNRHGAAWRDGPVGGTPAAVNAAFVTNPRAVIARVEHSPAVPRSSDSVLVTCRVSATSPVDRVRVRWRREGSSEPEDLVTLHDDGVSGDGEAGDGIYGGTLPPQTDGSIIAYRVESRLGDGRTTTAPQPPPVPPYEGFEGPFYLYQVTNRQPPVNPSPTYHIVMTEADQNELESRPVESNVLLYATAIARPRFGKASVHHLAGLRYRGSATRDEDPRSYRVEFPAESTFEGIEHLNLNSQEIDNEVLAADFFRRAGLAAPQVWTANLFFQGDVNPRYVRKERLDGRFLTRYFGDGSDDGNLYRAINPDDNGTFPEQGNLEYLGPDPETYPPYYDKRNNREENNYSDIIELCRTFDPEETPDQDFPNRLQQVVDVRQWARFFAAQACLANEDGGIWSNSGEDYALYRVPEDSNRPDAGKWILIPWDSEEVYGNEDERLFRPSIPAIVRFLTHQLFAPHYYSNVVNLRSGTFSRRETRQRFRLINFLFGFGTIDGIDSYITSRIGFFDENIPMEISAGTDTTDGILFVTAGDTWRYFKGTAEPSGGTLAWAARGFNDSDWLEGPSGFGYGDSDDNTILDDMEQLDDDPDTPEVDESQPGYGTLYIRRRFQIEDPSAIDTLELSVDYDDGFVAYLNGTEVARRELGEPETPVPFDATANLFGGHGHEAGEPEAIDISSFVGELRAGTNVLAIQGVNQNLDSSDFSLIPELGTGPIPAGGLGCGEILYATDSTVGLAGRSNACETWWVTVNGQIVDYDTFLARWEGSVQVDPGDNLVTLEAFNVLGDLLETKQILVRRVSGDFSDVGGTLTDDTVWTAAGGPYLLTGDVIVPQGITLTIRSGAEILGQPGASIIVHGRLTALGTQSQQVIFRAASCDDRWGGIAIEDTGTDAGDPTHLLRYCDFAFGDLPPGFEGHVAPVDSKILVDRCTFRHLTANAIDGTDARMEVTDCLFEKIHEGVHGTSSTVIILDSTFQGMVGDKDGIDFDLNGTERSRIERCLFLDGSDDGIDLLETTVDIRDNIFVNVQDKAISLEENGPLGAPTVTGNLVFNCGTAIALKNGVTVNEGHNNTIVGNQEGINLFARAGASDGGHGTFHSMIVWNNIVDVQLDDRSTVTLTHSNVSDTIWPGDGNISLDPMFTDVAGLDFALRPGSPCIGTGLEGSDMGAIPFEGTNGFVRADTDADGSISLTDVIGTLDYLFRAFPRPPCLDRADANDDGEVDISDPLYTLFFLYAGGEEPPPPFPTAGADPTPDGLPCP